MRPSLAAPSCDAHRPAGDKVAGPRGVALLGTTLVLVVVTLALGLFPAPVRAAAPVDDWVHVWEVLRMVKAELQPLPPQIYYLGDSTARESIVSDTVWSAQLARLGAPGNVQAHLVGGHNQTFGMDRAIVDRLPSRAGQASRDLVVIGVGLTRFIRPPGTARSAHLKRVAPGRRPRLSPWSRHKYDGVPPMPEAQRRQIANLWTHRPSDIVGRNLPANLAALEGVIRALLAKNLRPVLVELPLDLPSVGTTLDALRASYQSGCADIATRNDVPYVSFQREIALPSADFYDLWHLVHPGAVTWQLWLSRAVVPLIPQPSQP